MALNQFIPQVWAARLLENLHKNLVYGQAGIANRDYEGDIKEAGDTVKISAIGAVTIGNYGKNTNIGDPEDLTDGQGVLAIDQQKFFNFQIDDIDKAQQKPKVMDGAMGEAAYGLANVADQFLAGLYVDVASGNTIGDDTTPIVPTATTAYEYLVDCATKLNEANVPEVSRWVIVPPWYYGLLLKDVRFTNAQASGSTEALRNGQVGQISGMRVLASNNVPNTAGAKYKIQAGWPGAISYAEQVISLEGYRPQQRFGDAMKGLHVYGGKLVRPTGLVVLTASKT